MSALLNWILVHRDLWGRESSVVLEVEASLKSAMLLFPSRARRCEQVRHLTLRLLPLPQPSSPPRLKHEVAGCPFERPQILECSPIPLHKDPM